MRLFFVALFAVLSFAVFADENPGQLLSAHMEEAVEIASSLDDSALAAQLIITGIDGKVSLAPSMRSLLERIPAGAVMLFRYNLDTTPAGVKSLLEEVYSLTGAKTGVPAFMAVDHEGGLVHRFAGGIERLPSAYSFWELAQREGRDTALSYAETLYSLSAEEISALGITMVMGPVAETLNDDNRLFLDTRSYGSDPDFTLAASAAFIKSMGAAGILSVVKHFPGNTAVDPHSGISTLDIEKDALDEMVIPFAGLIRDLQPQAIMVSHTVITALDHRRTASLSAPVIEGWLRGELGFDGIVIADDFSMAAVSGFGISPETAAVEALNAGVDMIMAWPMNISAVHNAILEALRGGQISRERLLEAAERIIACKIFYGLMEESR